MTIFLALILTVVAFTLAACPLLKRKPALSSGSTTDEDMEELQSHRNTTYSMLKELDFDFESGILSKDDYEALRNRYKRKAATILRDMDGLQQGTDADDEIEKRVLAFRQRKDNRSQDSDVLDEIEAKVLALRQRKGSRLQDSDTVDEIEEGLPALRRRRGQFCTQCGTRHEPHDRFCAQCGTKLSGEGE